jgi:hypothetical protein
MRINFCRKITLNVPSGAKIMLHRVAKIALRNIFATNETYLLLRFTQQLFGFTQQLFGSNRITAVREHDYRDAKILLPRRCNGVTCQR